MKKSRSFFTSSSGNKCLLRFKTYVRAIPTPYESIVSIDLLMNLSYSSFSNSITFSNDAMIVPRFTRVLYLVLTAFTGRILVKK